MERRISIAGIEKLTSIFSDLRFAINHYKDVKVPLRYLSILRVSLDSIEARLKGELKPPCPDEIENNQTFFKL